VKIVAYRIARRRFARTMWSGAGAKEHGGRWNSKGIAVVYASENRSLAAMEQLVYLLPPRVLRGFVISSVEFDEKQLERVNIKDLPAGWDRTVPPAALRRIGDEWAGRGKSVALAVPSAVVRGEWNYLLNPEHEGFAALVRSTPVRFVYDRRLL
jgi:RES domain-containing protein